MPATQPITTAFCDPVHLQVHVVWVLFCLAEFGHCLGVLACCDFAGLLGLYCMLAPIRQASAACAQLCLLSPSTGVLPEARDPVEAHMFSNLQDCN